MENWGEGWVQMHHVGVKKNPALCIWKVESSAANIFQMNCGIQICIIATVLCKYKKKPTQQFGIVSFLTTSLTFPYKTNAFPPLISLIHIIYTNIIYCYFHPWAIFEMKYTETACHQQIQAK